MTVRSWRYNDLIVEQRVPASAFKPEKASAAQLDFYGLPGKPSDPSEMAQWRDDVGNFKAPALTPIDGLCTMQIASNLADSALDTDPNDIDTLDLIDTTTLKVPDPGTAPRTSSNWAGYVAGGHSDYTKATGRITEPTETKCSDTEWNGHFTWVGIGGDGAGLMQNGTGSGMLEEAHLNSLTHFAWWEIMDTGSNDSGATPVVRTTMLIRGGDDVKFSTTYVPDLAQPHVAFWWKNFTTGDVYTYTVRGTVNPGVADGTMPGAIINYYDGRMAEAIDERPGRWVDNGDGTRSLFFTMNRGHSKINWTQTTVAAGSGPNSPIRDESYARYIMKQKYQDTRLERPKGVAGAPDSFTSTHLGCGTVEFITNDPA